MEPKRANTQPFQKTHTQTATCEFVPSAAASSDESRPVLAAAAAAAVGEHISTTLFPPSKVITSGSASPSLSPSTSPPSCNTSTGTKTNLLVDISRRGCNLQQHPDRPFFMPSSVVALSIIDDTACSKSVSQNLRTSLPPSPLPPVRVRLPNAELSARVTSLVVGRRRLKAAMLVVRPSASHPAGRQRTKGDGRWCRGS